MRFTEVRLTRCVTQPVLHKVIQCYNVTVRWCVKDFHWKWSAFSQSNPVFRFVYGKSFTVNGNDRYNRLVLT